MQNIIRVLLLLLVMPIYLYGQKNGEAEMETDRPTRAQGPAVVPPAVLQIESGYNFQSDATDLADTKEKLYPTTLFRIGIFKNAELRLNTDYKKEKVLPHRDKAGNTISEEHGFTGVQIGTKVTIYKGNGVIPQVGILSQLTLRVGNKAFRPAQTAPEGWLLLSQQLTDKLQVQYNIGYRKQNEPLESGGEAVYAATGSYKLTDRLTGFAEVFGQKPKADKAEHGLDAGLLFQVLPNLQIDIIGGYGLNEEAPDYFAGGGVSWRIPQ